MFYLALLIPLFQLMFFFLHLFNFFEENRLCNKKFKNLLKNIKNYLCQVKF